MHAARAHRHAYTTYYVYVSINVCMCVCAYRGEIGGSSMGKPYSCCDLPVLLFCVKMYNSEMSYIKIIDWNTDQ